MPEPFQHAAWHLLNKLGVKEYTLGEVVERIKLDVTPGQTLAKGPNYLRTEEQLYALYAALEHEGETHRLQPGGAARLF